MKNLLFEREVRKKNRKSRRDAERKTTATTSTTRLQGKLLAFEFINASERFGKTGCHGREIMSRTKQAEWTCDASRSRSRTSR